MQHLIDDVRKALTAEAWYAATTLALALPDIASKLDARDGASTKDRYLGWLHRYFMSFVTAEGHVFLEADEVYGLRCKLVHEGDFWITDEPGGEMHHRANFIELCVSDIEVVPSRRTASGTDPSTSYSVGVEEFCDWLCSATERWLADVRGDERIQREMKELLKVRDLRGFPWG